MSMNNSSQKKKFHRILLRVLPSLRDFAGPSVRANSTKMLEVEVVEVVELPSKPELRNWLKLCFCLRDLILR
eukprot:scaffold1509_cov240-Pinguiococcus_pyrenoidosus.AAC.1